MCVQIKHQFALSDSEHTLSFHLLHFKEKTELGEKSLENLDKNLANKTIVMLCVLSETRNVNLTGT